MERDQSKEARALRAKEYQLKQLTEITDAEIKAQRLSNEISTQLAAASTKTGAKNQGRSRVALLDAVEEEKSLQELKKQLDARRIQLEYEARAKHKVNF